MQTFRIRATQQGLANLSAGTLKPAGKIIEEQVARRKLVGSARQLQRVDREWAFAADLLAAHKMFLMMLTLKTGESIADWDARAQAECDLGADGIRKMLQASLEEGVTVQQPLAFERVVGFLSCFLGPGERPGSENAMLHVMNTLPILPAADELELSNRGCIMLPGGALTQPGCAPTMCPAVSFAVQSGKGHCKGIGVRAEENIQPGTKLGVYAPTFLVESLCAICKSSRMTRLVSLVSMTNHDYFRNICKAAPRPTSVDAKPPEAVSCPGGAGLSPSPERA